MEMENYSDLLNKDPVPLNPETATAAANAPTDLSISEDEVTLDEVRNAVKSLKNDRAAGICKIRADFESIVVNMDPCFTPCFTR